MIENQNSHSHPSGNGNGNRIKALWAVDETPSDLEAEMIVLGAILIADEPTRARILASVPSDDAFLSDDHRIIFNAIAETHNAGRPVDGYLIRSILSDRGELEGVGGVAYLGTLLNCVPCAAHGEAYVERLAEVYRLRILDTLTERIRKAVRRPVHARDKADQIIEKTQNELAALVASGSANDIRSIGQVMEDVLKEMKGGGAPRVSSGMLAIDEALAGGFGMGEMALIAARPSMGKSLWGKQLADLMATRVGVPVGYVTIEECNQKLGRNWLSRNAKIANRRVRQGALTHEEWKGVDAWCEYAKTIPLYSCDRAMTLNQVCNAITLMRARFNIKAAFVDYVQLIETRSKERREQEVATVSRRLKNLFKRLGIAGVVIAQVNRGNEKAGKNPRPPRLSDLRESGQLEQDADVVMMIHRPGYYKRGNAEADNSVQIILAKNRDGSRGNDVHLEANLEHQEFIDHTDTVEDHV